MSDIFTEVDDAVKQEKLEKFWKDNGNLIIGVVILIIVGTAAMNGWLYYKRAHFEKQTEAFLAAIQEDDLTAAYEARKDELKGLHAQMLLIRAGEDALGLDEPEKAIGYFQTAAEAQDVDPFFRDFARLKYARALMAVKTESEDGAESQQAGQNILNYLDKMAADHNNPWYNQANFLSAQVAAYHMNNDELALRHLSNIQKSKISQPALTKAINAMESVINYRAAKKAVAAGDSQ